VTVLGILRRRGWASLSSARKRASSGHLRADGTESEGFLPKSMAGRRSRTRYHIQGTRHASGA
jgi:hypothetical protein